MLNLISLKDTTKCEDILHGVGNCLLENNFGLEIRFGISTDGVPAMIDKEKGDITLLIDKIESNNNS